MIRKSEKTDIDIILDIWLNTNLKAHNFISREYWESNLDTVRKMLPLAEVYLYEKFGKIQALVSLMSFGITDSSLKYHLQNAKVHEVTKERDSRHCNTCGNVRRLA